MHIGREKDGADAIHYAIYDVNLMFAHDVACRAARKTGSDEVRDRVCTHGG